MATFPKLDVDAVLARYKISREEFCERLGLGMPALRSWLRGDRRPSTQACQLAEELFGIRKYELRPDIWPPPPARQQRRCRAMAA